MVEAAPSSLLEMGEADFALQLLVIAFDPPTQLGDISLRLAASSFFFRPPTRPSALVAVRRAEVCSLIMARSNSAKAPSATSPKSHRSDAGALASCRRLH